MTRRTKLILAAGIGLAAVVGGAGAAYAMAAQADTSAELRATGLVGEQADGYLGVVGNATPALRARVNAVNIKRRAFYTELAGRRSAKIEEVAAATACEMFATRVMPGQYYRLPDGIWRRREGNAPVPRPTYCG